MISDTVAQSMVRSWRIARLNSGTEALGFPVEEPFSRGYVGGRGPYIPPAQELTDAERVQSVVDRMTKEIRSAFEAYHLALIREERCTGMPHKARAAILGIAPSTYFLRVKHGFGEVKESVFIEEGA